MSVESLLADADADRRDAEVEFSRQLTVLVIDIDHATRDEVDRVEDDGISNGERPVGDGLGCIDDDLGHILDDLDDDLGHILDDLDDRFDDILGCLADPFHGVLDGVADAVPEVVPVAHVAASSRRAIGRSRHVPLMVEISFAIVTGCFPGWSGLTRCAPGEGHFPASACTRVKRWRKNSRGMHRPLGLRCIPVQ